MVHSQIENILLSVIKNIKDYKKEEVQILFDELQPYDTAELYKVLPVKHRLKFILCLLPKQLAVLIQELESDLQLDILHALGIEKSSQVLDLMENDDLADLLNELSEDKMKEFLSSMQTEESQTVQNLMQYPPETAGGIMTNRYVWIRSYYSVREAIDKIKAFAKIAENIYYLYVLDEDKKLVGVVSYRDLLLADIHDSIREIMYNRVISVPVTMDQEHVATMIERYDFIAIPVVDEENQLVGIITVDDVIDVMITEANEDIHKLSASGGASIDFNTSALTASMRRLPWLVLLLFLGLLSGNVISSFEGTLEKIVALTFFMPMIAGMTGNTGTQSLAIVVRGLVTQHLDKTSFFKLLFREFGVGFIIGTVCGVLITIISYFWQEDMILSFVIGSSLFLTLIIGTLAGTIIPLILYQLKVDPAIASGPLITTLNDIFSLTVYFGLATFFISYF